MKILILISIAVPMLVGCASSNSVTALNSCGGSGSKELKIHYGDSQLRVTPRVVKTRRQGELVFKLRPHRLSGDPVNYNTVTVTIEGKTPNDSWITGSGTYDTAPNRKIVVCVPPMQNLAVYSYFIDVQHVGKLDPRAEVEL